MATADRPCEPPKDHDLWNGQDIPIPVSRCAKEDSELCSAPRIIQGFGPAAAIPWRVPPVEDVRAKWSAMSHDVGVWIDHKKAVIVSIAAGEVTTRTLTSDVGAHPHYSGSRESGGEKKYEERHKQNLDRYYDDVIGQLGEPDALLLFGPGEAKLQLKERLGRAKGPSERIVAVESTDKLTDPQIVAKVKEHYRTAR
jgi:hypothetical protein